MVRHMASGMDSSTGLSSGGGWAWNLHRWSMTIFKDVERVLLWRAGYYRVGKSAERVGKKGGACMFLRSLRAVPASSPQGSEIDLVMRAGEKMETVLNDQQLRNMSD